MKSNEENGTNACLLESRVAGLAVGVAEVFWVKGVPIGSIVVPVWDYLIGSQIQTTKRNYNGAYR